MMAVIFFCLRPLPGRGPRPANSKGSAHKQAAYWQLGSYIWVPPPENPQGLAQLYVRRLFICKEKSAGFVDFRRDCGKFLFRNQPACPYPRPALSFCFLDSVLFALCPLLFHLRAPCALTSVRPVVGLF